MLQQVTKHVFYVTLYQTKHNQKEESCTYHNICLALSKRIKRQQEQLTKEREDGTVVTEEVSPDFGEGLSRMLSSLYGHTSSNVLSATMSRKLLSHGSRFQYSHEFAAIPLKHLLQWLAGDDNLLFKLRRVSHSDGEYGHVQDIYINNMMYRPSELEHVSLYEMVSTYVMKKMSKKKIESEDPIVESNTTFNLLEEHPSHKYMVLSKRKHIYVPCISSINLLPNIADLDIGKSTTDATILKQREEYAKIVLLLFYPYRTPDDLMLIGSYWNKYELVLKEKKYQQSL